MLSLKRIRPLLPVAALAGLSAAAHPAPAASRPAAPEVSRPAAPVARRSTAPEASRAVASVPSGEAAPAATRATVPVGAAGTADIPDPPAETPTFPVLPEARAHHLLEQALKAARHQRLDAAWALVQRAAAGHDNEPEFALASTSLRRRAAIAHLERGTEKRDAGQFAAAEVEFRTAMAIDPSEGAAAEALRELLLSHQPAPPSEAQLRVGQAAAPVQAEPSPGTHALAARGGTRAILAAFGQAFGLRVWVENDLPERNWQLDLTAATYAEAMRALHLGLGVDAIALDPHTLYFLSSKDYATWRRLGLRTFYLRDVADPKDLAELAQVLRTTLGLTGVQVNPAQQSITVRAAPEELDAAERLLNELRQGPGDVLLEVQILSVSNSLATKLGVGPPNTFQAFMLAPILRQLSAAGDLQALIDQLFAQGGLNGLLNSGQLSSQLAQLQNQLSPLLKNPFLVFGGGATLMALTVPSLSVELSGSREHATDIENAWLRSRDGQAATLKFGQRYPIVNATFSPATLNPALTKLIGNNSFIQPFPSFTYEDLGLNLKVTPWLTGDHEIRLKLNAEVRSLSGAQNNGMPILADRTVQTEITVRDGEPTVIAGLLDSETTNSLAGLPGLGQVPGLGLFVAKLEPSRSDQRLMLVITPHVLGLGPEQSAAIWLPPTFGLGQPTTGSRIGPRGVPEQYNVGPAENRGVFQPPPGRYGPVPSSSPPAFTPTGPPQPGQPVAPGAYPRASKPATPAP